MAQKSIDPILQGKKRDVIIIGAGLSGLSAAKELASNGLDVLVLEARDRVGGRTLTKVSGEKNGGDGKFWVDLGGSYVGPTQNCVLNLIEELKLETYLVEDSQDIAYVRSTGDGGKGERRSRYKPELDPPIGNIFNWLDYVHMIKLIDSLGSQIPSEAPWLAPKATEWDSKSYKQFVDESTWTKRVRGFFNNIHLTVDICCESNEVSMLWFLWYVKQCGGFGRSIATTNGGQERKIRGGTQQLSKRLVNLIGKERILLKKPVCQVDQTRGPFALVRTLDGAWFRADHLIFAISPHLWLKIHYEPALPSGKNLLAQRSPMGQVSKVILYYEKAFWKAHNFSGCFLIDAENRESHPIVLSLDETKEDGSHPAVIGFAAARGWFEMRDKSDLQVANIVAKSYARATGLDQFLDFISVERFDWTQEQYSGGCYTSTHQVNTLIKFGPYLRQPFGRIYYAGTETAIKWSGYMDGAISAGKRAAREILHARGDIAETQIWQEEPDSSLVPPKPFEYPQSHKYAPSMKCCLITLAHLLLASGALSFVVYRRLSGNR